MFYCVHCGKSLSLKMQFCPYCGKEQPQLEDHSPSTAPIASTPISTYTVPTAAHTAFTYDAQPTMPKVAKTLGTLSLWLGIAALFTGFLLVMIMVAYLATDSSFGIGFELISVPLGVAAIILCSLARKKGNYLKKPKLGRLFGIIGLVLTLLGVILFFVYIGKMAENFIDELPDFSV